MTPQTIDPEQREKRQSEIFEAAVKGIIAARPRLFIAEFLWIRDNETKSIVPMEPTLVQDIFLNRAMGPMRSWKDAMDILALKARQVRVTSICQAIQFSAAEFIPGFQVLRFFQSDKTGEQMMNADDLFWERQPPFIEQAYVRKGERWGKDYKEFQHVRLKGGKFVTWGAISSIRTVSAEGDYGRAPSPSMIHYSEYQKYRHGVELTNAVNPSLVHNGWRVREFTPEGTDNLGYRDYQAMKKGEIGGERIVFYWHMNPTNRLPRGHITAPPADRGPLVFTEEERTLVDSPEFVRHEGVDIEEQIRWRRTMIAERVASMKGNVDAGKALFLQEFMEDDISCWASLTGSLYDQGMLVRMIAQAMTPIRTVLVHPNVELKVWREQEPGMVYSAGFDPALGTETGHATAGYIQEAESGLYVASLYGRKCPLERASEEMFKLCRRYNEAYTVVDDSGGYGQTPLSVARAMDFRRLWRPTVKEGEKPKPYGLKLTGSWTAKNAVTNKIMMEHVGDINAGRARTYDLDLINDMSSYKPDEGDHPPDLWIAAVLANMARNDRRVFAGQASVAATRRDDFDRYFSAPVAAGEMAGAGPALWGG